MIVSLYVCQLCLGQFPASNATVTLIPRSTFTVSIGGGYLTFLADINNCHRCVVGFTLFVMKAPRLVPAQITNCLLSFVDLLLEGIITSCIFVCLCLPAAVLMGWEVPCCSCSCFSLPQGTSACGEEKQFLVIVSPSCNASDTGCSVIWNIIPLISEGGGQGAFMLIVKAVEFAFRGDSGKIYL